MSRQLRILSVLLGFWAALALWAGPAWADAFDPPESYYNTATGTGATLKGQLHNIIDDHTVLSYDSARSNLQITDQDPADSDHMLLVYNRVSLDVSAINPGGSIPGWDSGVSWDREHTWPRSRGVGTSGPDNSDLHQLRPSTPSVNNSRGNKTFGGDFGQPFGPANENSDYWYPGDEDAGMIARQQFYMAVRYDGGDANTLDLEITDGDAPNPGGDNDPPPQMGDLASMIQWHFVAPPDDFERRRNQIIYDDYQENRNPFVDRPEFVWSIFVDQLNDSQITISGGTDLGGGASSRDVDLGRVFVGGAVPVAQNFNILETGDDGTYYEVTAAGDATSTVTGRYNAFAMNAVGNRPITVGLDPGTSTAVAGLKSGTVTVDNLDVTTGFGAGHGAQDGNDVFNVDLAVVDHATPSFDGFSDVTSLMFDFGSVFMGTADPTFNFDLFNLEETVGYTGDLDFDSVMSSGDTGVLSTDLAALAGSLSLDGGTSQGFTVTFDTAAIGMFSATYTLMVSDEDLVGELTDSLSLTVMGQIVAAALSGDYNGNDVIDAADYGVWRDAVTAGGTSLLNDPTPGTVDESDFLYWRDHFGESLGAGATGSASASPAVPEPASLVLMLLGSQITVLAARRRRPFAG